LGNSPDQEKATALIEIAKIANLRLDDIVEEPVAEPELRPTLAAASAAATAVSSAAQRRPGEHHVLGLRRPSR
jgi:hypothetical protein